MNYRSLCTASAAAALAAAAFSALPASAQTTDKSDWSGWYLGVNAGGNWGNTDQKLFATPGNGTVVIPPADVGVISSLGSGGAGNPAGFAGGIEGGYDYRSTSVLAGIETDFGFLNLEQKRASTFQSGLLITPPIMATVGQRTTTDWAWTLRPRLGYITGNWLFYATGGLALGDIKLTTSYSDTTGRAASNERTQTKAGWTIGAGLGYAFAHNWSVKAEYLYADFGSISSTAVIPNGYGSVTSNARAKTNILRAGIDYHF